MKEKVIVARPSYTSFIKDVKAKKVSQVQIVPKTNSVVFEQDDGKYAITTLPPNNEYAFKTLEENNVDIFVQPYEAMGDNSGSNLFSMLLTGVFLYSIFRSLPQNPLNRKSEFTVDEKTDGVMLSDVAGIDAIKYEVEEIVKFLKNPETFQEVGAKIPRGCLLSGPPGTGKTMIAKAIANEAGVPFISCSASQFVELFVGLGASRIRKLFEKARSKSPCIIFIDEIDAVGKSRSSGAISGGGNEEREQTLNQLLTEMDGFSGTDSTVIVLAATNRADVLDPALLRPGRFDRKIEVPLPTRKGREEILKVHASKRKLCDDVSLEVVAGVSSGMSGAQLENVVNESAILAARDGRKKISNDDILNAFDKVTLGLPGGEVPNERILTRIAYHEAGHAVLGYLFEDFDILYKVTIQPRGRAGGYAAFLPWEEDMYTREYLERKITVAMGGHAAEEIIFGKDNVSVGASQDFKQATSIASDMIKKYGFSKLSKRSYSENSKDIDNEISDIIDSCWASAYGILNHHRKQLERVKDALLEYETIDRTQIEECFDIVPNGDANP